jgi:hypothetical protein
MVKHAGCLGQFDEVGKRSFFRTLSFPANLYIFTVHPAPHSLQGINQYMVDYIIIHFNQPLNLESSRHSTAKKNGSNFTTF